MIRSLRIFVATYTLVAPAGLHATGCGATKPDALDAVVVAADTHTVLMDNETIRILDVKARRDLFVDQRQDTKK